MSALRFCASSTFLGESLLHKILEKVVEERVSPKEIENGLCEMKGVAEAAVIGVADELFGQAIKAFIVRKTGKQLR